jgi:DNA-dependent RNA polymerase
MPFDARVLWVGEDLEHIECLIDIYLRNIWWIKADSPFFFLAACFEPADALQTAIPSTYPFRLPVVCNGRCSGIQHLSMMTRSGNEARLADPLSMDTICDVNATVVRLVAERLYADASRTDWPEDQAWKGKAGSDPMRIIINDDPEQGPTIEMEEDGGDMFVIVSGVPVAKRSKTGTPEAGTWVSLEPGWTVTSVQHHDRTEISIAYDGRPVLH